jgi:hypothetical protein
MSTTIDRRAILAGAASLPAISIPAVAAGAEPDPIYAAIAECRAAILAWSKASRADSKMETDLANEFSSTENPVAAAADDPRYIMACEETERLYEIADDAAEALLDVKPTTVTGAVALLRLGFERDIVDTWWTWPENVTEHSRKFDGHDWFAALSRYVAEALERMVQA